MARVKVAVDAGAVSVSLFTLVAVATPKVGVTNIGEPLRTSSPVPLSSDIAAAKLELDAVARNVATFAPKPDTPVLIGKPVALVNVAADGVPKSGVVSAGDVPNTNNPDPVSLVTAAAMFALDGVANAVATLAASPETPVLIGKPVALVKVAADGVPKSGVVKAGDVANTNRPEPVSLEITPASSADVVAAKSLSLFDVVAKVPLVGKVTPVVPVAVNVVA